MLIVTDERMVALMGDNRGDPVLFWPLAWGGAPMDEGEFMLPTGTVSFLLADVEGSTKAWEADAEETAEGLADLNRTVDELIGRFDGVRPLEQGEGDSFVAAFARARDAVGCALAIQQALAGHSLRLRIGVHTGDVQRRDERNYAGPAVNRTARIRDLAHGGQTLVSQATGDLVVDRLPEGASLRDVGSHRLKDLARPERVYQLDHPDLPADFPPVRSLDIFTHNLPVQRTSFIGRAAEMAQLRALLRESALVTVTGAGGCGKTRLALQVAAEVVADWPDGVWLVDLAAVRDASGVLGQVADVIGARETPGVSLHAAVVARLALRRALIVLDNCEHVVEDTARLVNDLLDGCPAVRLLATSRQPLGVDGELTWRLPSLPVPADDGPAGIVSVSACEAGQLFVERARRARAGFELSERNAAAVGEICRRLDGIPLAIELAAARTRVLTPAQIADGLSERFRLLTGSTRSALPRQQTLQASVDWSYGLLTAPEQAVFRSLAVFAGSFDFNAAEQVCTDGTVQAHQVLDLLSLLIDKSLVVVDDSGEQARYRLLETLRLYALQRLRAVSEEQAAHARHLDYYTSLATRSDTQLRRSRQAEWLARVALEYPNLRAALAWTRDRGDSEGLLRLATALGPAWAIIGPWAEGRSYLDSALAAAEGQSPALWARAACDSSVLALATGDLDTAFTLAEQALGSARDLGDDRLTGRCLYQLGLINLDNADVLDEAEGLARRAGDPYLLADVLWAAGEAQAGKDTRRAIAYARASLEVCDAHGLDPTAAQALGLLGVSSWDTGQLSGAIAAIDEAIDRAGRCGAVFADLRARVVRGPLLAHLGRLSDALAAADDLERASREAASPLYAGIPECVRGLVALGEGRSNDARQLLTDAASRKPLAGVRGFILTRLAEAQLAAGDRAEAEQTAAEAIETALVSDQVFARCVLARLRRAAGEPVTAEAVAHDVLSRATAMDLKIVTVEALEVLAGIATDVQRHEEAVRLFGAAAQLRDTTGYRYCVNERQSDLATLRAGLGDEEFDRLFTEARALSIDDAVAYARRGRGERKRPSAGWESLTPVETQVVALVKRGLSNAEIGQRLFISPRTVQSHLTHVFAKLGVASRTDLAAQAVKRGL
jgi:predicted ATPase/class 3 adenylate cyclase/DNA-binding CsgD family transcriptional regulator